VDSAAHLAPVRVLGLGNVLMGDDAFGPWVIEELLARWEIPAAASVVDVGTPGLDLTPYLGGADAVLLVDTVKADGPPGRIHVYEKRELLRLPAAPRLSPHDPGLAEALLALTLAGSEPREAVLVGAVPASVAMGVGLSRPLRRAVATAAAEVLRRLAALGIPCRPRPDALDTSPWWEKPVRVA
jgi:hydrogenase maturation protease